MRSQLDAFYQNYDLYARKEDYLPALLLVEQAKRECGYDNPKNYRNILFDEEALSKLASLFPEENMSTDYDAAKVVEKYGDDAVPELQRRMKNQTADE